MNKDSISKDLDVFISLLGEIDMIKSAVSALDKSTHIALSQDEISTVLGNSRCFNILKLIEKLNADISLLNASYLNSAELVTEGIDGKEKKTSSWSQDIVDGRKKIEDQQSPKKPVDKEKQSENEIITNMLSYFRERFEKNE